MLAMHALYTYAGLDWIFGGMDAMQGVCLEARAEEGGAQEERRGNAGIGGQAERQIFMNYLTLHIPWTNFRVLCPVFCR